MIYFYTLNLNIIVFVCNLLFVNKKIVQEIFNLFILIKRLNNKHLIAKHQSFNTRTTTIFESKHNQEGPCNNKSDIEKNTLNFDNVNVGGKARSHSM